VNMDLYVETLISSNSFHSLGRVSIRESYE
jgi:hypothetical protein